jgi:bifunctional non-homologous end joining protein LigD
MWPKAAFTKGDTIDYYARIAPALLPHLRGRALTRVRYPNGVEEMRFFEKRAPKGTPDWVRTAPIVMGSEGTLEFIVCDDLATLTWLGQLAALELHPSLSLADDPETPTVLVFDLDPGPPATIVECCRVALTIRALFERFGLELFPKTSGSKGLQLYAPLNSDVSYDDTKPFAHALAQALERSEPELVLSRMKKELRKGKVFVDWSQNDRAKTTVAVYSLRAKDRPTVSTPLHWDEVSETAAEGDPDRLRFDAAQVLDRVAEHGDLFAPVQELEQELPDPSAIAP